MYMLPTPAPPLPPPLPLLASWPSLPGGASGSNGTAGDGPGGELPSNWSSLIGIVTAIVGNVLIALALNVQRYAHLQLHKERQQNRARARQALKDAKRDAGRGGGRGATSTNGHSKRAGNGGYGAVEGSGSRPGPGDGAHESDPLTASFCSGSDADTDTDTDTDTDARPSTSYLRSPYWWLGQVLITVGEMGNFLAYGFAPASIVSPLGVVALISNCVIAPMLFNEAFRKRDFGGVVVAMAGAVTVVLSAKQEETKLNPHDVWDAITTTAFVIYAGATCALIALLMWASPRYGHRTILIDLGLVGLFGGYTVLATKGVSSMLSSTLLRAFLTPMTYVLLVILLGTAVMQVRYVNKALQRFDSTQVIPIQFVMFTLSVIVGSAVLYRDFERTTAEQAAKFVGGCLLTFLGVFIITSGRPRVGEGEDGEGEAGEGEAGEGEAGEDGVAGEAGDEDDGTAAPAARVSISLAEQPADDGGDGDDDEPTQPLLENPWRSASFSAAQDAPAAAAGALRPALGPSPSSADAVLHAMGTAPPPADRPMTPSAALRPPSQFLHQSPMISPSPLLSSTVSAVVADTILQHLDGAGAPTARRPSTRRVRPSLRSSLFVPQDELLLDDAERLLAPLTGAQSHHHHHHHHHHNNNNDNHHHSSASSTAGVPPASAGDRRAVQTSSGPPPARRQSSRDGRSRARSLSTTLGGLFWPRQKSAAAGDEESAGPDDDAANDDLPSAAVTESESPGARQGYF